VPPTPIGCGRRTLHIYPRIEGFLYLAFILDVYSRKVVGWSMASHLRTELVAAAVEMAIRRRNPSAGLIHHSERGAHYTALSFGKKLEEAGIMPSMSRVGSALDNAISESFLSTLKSEIGVSRYPERQTARASIFEFIERFLQPGAAPLIGWLSEPV
jgi:putative transposase